MKTKRILILSAIILGTVFAYFGANRLLLGRARQKGDAALYSGDYPTAILNYDKLIKAWPENPGVYYNRGDAYAGDGQHIEAIADYRRSIQLGIRDSLQAVLRIALSAKAMGDKQTEESYLKRLLCMAQAEPGYTTEIWAANYHLGRMEFSKGNYRKAINYYNAAHAVHPTDFEIYHRANAYFALGKTDSARIDLRKSLVRVKADFVKENPNSYLAECDTCSLPFGSKEYEQLTDEDSYTFFKTFNKYLTDSL